MNASESIATTTDDAVEGQELLIEKEMPMPMPEEMKQEYIEILNSENTNYQLKTHFTPLKDHDHRSCEIEDTLRQQGTALAQTILSNLKLDAFEVWWMTEVKQLAEVAFNKEYAANNLDENDRWVAALDKETRALSQHERKVYKRLKRWRGYFIEPFLNNLCPTYMDVLKGTFKNREQNLVVGVTTPNDAMRKDGEPNR